MILKPRPILFSLLLIVLCTLTAFADDPATASGEEPDHAFDRILEKYEIARYALAHDTVEGVTEQGAAIRAILQGLSKDWSPNDAGIAGEEAQDVRDLLPTLAAAADALAEATSLDAARDAFYELSKPLVRWRKAVSGDRPAVVYCPMIRRSWLQPEEDELGNPYHGQEMEHCGSVVDS